jgi:hypothetical protein
MEGRWTVVREVGREECPAGWVERAALPCPHQSAMGWHLAGTDGAKSDRLCRG